MKKRLLAQCLVLVLCLLATLIPSFPANAEEGDVTREEWIHRLVETFDLSVEENAAPDNYYPDLSTEDNYYSDMITGIQFGLLDVDAGENVEPTAAATREFAAHTLNLCLGYQPGEENTAAFSDVADCKYPVDDQIAVNQNWLSLVEGAFLPSKEITGAEADQMIAAATASLEQETVETNYENTYEYELTSDAVEIPADTVYEWVDETTLKITDCPDTLKEGSDFILHMDGIDGTYNAKSITKEGSVSTVTVGETDNQELVSSIDAQGELDLRNVYIEPAEGMDIYYVEKSTGETYDTLQNAIKAAPKSKKDGQIDLSGLKIKGSGKTNLSESISISVGFSLSKPKIIYKINTSKKKVSVKLTGELELNYKIEGEETDVLGSISDLKLFIVGVPGIGGFVVSTKAEAKASIAGKTTSNIEVGVAYDNGDLRGIGKFGAKQHTIQAEATAAVGLKASLGINDIPGDIVVAEVYLEGGAKASIKSETFNDGNKPDNCTHFAAYLYAEAGFEAKVKLGFSSISGGAEWEIVDETNSPMKVVKHYEDGKQVPGCTRGIPWSDKYYTGGNSIFSDSGWSGGDNSYLLDSEGKPYCIFTYSLNDDDQATITKYEGNMRNLTIPETIDGYTVIAIGNDVFNGNSLLTSVTFPSTVKSVGERAFFGCGNLSWINFAEGLETIGKQAFASCSFLTMVTIPDSVTTIYEGAFAQCTNLVRVTLSRNLTRMDAHAFFNDDKLDSIEIPKSLTTSNTAYIYEYAYDYQAGAFYGCDGLKNITFEQGTTVVAENLFANCPGIEEVSFNDTITSIRNYAFGNCDSLSKVTLPGSLTYLGRQSFAGCELLTEITIPDSVTTIDAGAFAACTNLAKVKLPKGLVRMNAHAFYNDDLITEIEIPKNLKEGDTAYIYEYAYDYQWGPFYGCDGLKNISFEKGTTEIPKGLFANCPGIEEVSLPDTITVIRTQCFANCKHLTKVNFAEGLTTIGPQAFANCSDLTSLILPDSVTFIYEGAFAQCATLSEVKLPKNLAKMNAHAFFNDDLVTEIEIPKSLKEGDTAYIYEYAYDYQWGPFYGCDGLKKVTFEEGTTEVTTGLFAHCPGIEEIVIPDTVITLEANSFLKATGLTRLTLGKNVETIGDSSFNGCTSLSAVEIPDSVKSMGTYVFNGCKSMTEAKLHTGCTRIPNYTFCDCSSLKSITFPEGLTTVGSYVFKNCTSLSEVKWNENLKGIEGHAFENCDSLAAVALPAKVSSLGDAAFYDCDGLVDLDIPDSVTSIGSKAFYTCELLKNVHLGTGLKTIPSYAFYECPAIEEIVIPFKVTKIAGYAFNNNTSLTAITIPRSVTAIETTAFSYPDKMKIYGVSGTYAETFATENGYTFISKEVKATGVSLPEPEITINREQTVLLQPKIEPADFTDAVTWRSSDTSVVTVDDGSLYGVSAGTATIKINVGDVSTNCTVTVLQPVNRIYIDNSPSEMEALDTFQFTASVSPNNANNKTVIWTSSDPSVAMIDENGLVTAKAKGTTTITATAADGNGAKATRTVKVSNNAVICTSAEELESPHNYVNNCSDFWVYQLAGAARMAVTFDEKTNIEEGFDYLYLYDAKKEQIGKYTGTELAGKTISIKGDTIRIKLVSDDAGNEWGFKVVKAEIDNSCLHESTSIQNVREATCTEEGYTGDEVCDECGTVIKAGTKVDALGHDWDYDHYEEESCDEDGREVYVCDRCGETKEEVIPATGHDMSDWETDSDFSCTEGGTETRYCYDCGYVESREIPASGHEWESVYTMDQEATCTEEGSQSIHCKNCSEKKDAQAIPALGHSWSAYTTTALPTVFKAGSQKRTCARCKKIQTRTLTKLTPKIKLSATKKTIKKKKSFTLTISGLARGDSVKSVKTSKKTIATVKKVKANQYKITGKKKGKAKITVMLKSGKKAVCTVTVK